jgi:glycosyltransferase involved in cell wall biosynthesis
MAQAPSSGLDQAKVVVGIPVYNQEDSIAKTIPELREVADEIIVCDDGSTDSSAKIAEAMNCKVIVHPQRLGLPSALESLFSSAFWKADVLVVVSADPNYKAADISKLAEAVLYGKCDVAIGSRSGEQSKSADTDTKISTVTGALVKDPTSPVRAYSREAIAKLIPALMEKKDVLHSAIHAGLRIAEFPISNSPSVPDIVGVARELRKKSRETDGRASSGPITRLFDFATVNHPLAIFGGLSIMVLIGALFEAYTVYKIHVSGSGHLILLDVIVTAVLFVIWLLLAVAGAVLYSLKRNAS